MSQQLLSNLQAINNNPKFSDIYNKMMEELYPKVKTINHQIALDLGFLYIYRHLNEDDSQNDLLKFWREKSKHQIVQLPMGEFHYRPYVDFIYLDKIMNGLFIETTLEQMRKFKGLSA